MKIAFVHDRLINISWAEKVFFDLIEETIEKYNYKLEYEIFCVFSDKKFIEIDWFKIKINSLISNDFILKKLDYRNFMPFFPILIYFLSIKINKYNPDKIIISSFAIAKNISSKKNKELYLHSPMQYVYEMYNENMNKLWNIKKIIYFICSKYLRYWDKKFINFDKIYFNSNYTKDLSKKVYWIDWSVKYPKIDQQFFEVPIVEKKMDYFVYMWRLVKFSREVDKIIQLFNITKETLFILWEWQDEQYLKSIAWSNIIFLWFIEDQNQKIWILKKSRWLINLTKESFWISSAESLALWIPIFWYYGWASIELINEECWILCKKKEIQSLVESFIIFKDKQFDYEKIRQIFKTKYFAK